MKTEIALMVRVRVACSTLLLECDVDFSLDLTEDFVGARQT